MGTVTNQYPWLTGAQVPSNTLNFLGSNQDYLNQLIEANTASYLGNPTSGYDWLTNMPASDNSFANWNSKYGSTVGAGIQGFAGLWGAWNGMKQNQLAKQQMNASLALSEKNYNNSVQTYNTQLEDRTKARAAATGASQESVTNYMNQNRLK